MFQDVRPSDGGLYECQVSYHDDVEKKLKKPIKLFVLGEMRFISGITDALLSGRECVSRIRTLFTFPSLGTLEWAKKEGTIQQEE